MEAPPRKRTTPNPSAKSDAPTARDLTVLADLVWAGFLSTRQIERLHFPSRRRAQRRLRALLDHGFVRAHLQAGALERENVYTATQLALERLVEAGVYDVEPPTLGRLPRISKLAHGLATREVFVEALCWERAREGRRVEALFEGELARDPELRERRLVPDVLLVLEAHGASARLYVEVDLGTETTTTLRAKFEKWSRYAPLARADARLVLVCERPARLRTLTALAEATGLAARSTGALIGEMPLLLSRVAPQLPAAPPDRTVRPGARDGAPGFARDGGSNATAFRPRWS